MSRGLEFANELVAQFGLKDLDAGDAGDLIWLAFDNLERRRGEPSWSPAEFSACLVKRLADERLVPPGLQLEGLRRAVEEMAGCVWAACARPMERRVPDVPGRSSA